MNTIPKRNTFLEIIRNVCTELNFHFSLFSQGWIIEVKHKNITKYIFGYSFPLNQDTASKICNDKSATYEILHQNGIPAIPHHLFHLYTEFFPASGNWSVLMELFKKYGGKLVVKPNEGTGGNGVYIAKNQAELELLVHRTLKSRHTFCVSPFIEIGDEYRVIVLDGNIQLVYRKVIPNITGDGKSSILELLGKQVTGISEQMIRHLDDIGMALDSVPEYGVEIQLHWKHNLGQGAEVDLLIEEEIKEQMITLALNAAQAVGITFASVDIVRDYQGNLMVIEINSGVMLVNFSLSGDSEYELAKSIYAKAIQKMMQ